MLLRSLSALAFVGLVVACTGGSGVTPPPGACTGLPDTLHMTVTGYVKCTCLNGTFTLTRESPSSNIWASTPITGCPGQSEPATYKLSNDPNNFGIGVTGDDSEPGSGNSDYAPVKSSTCAPVQIAGGGSEAGNITAFCPSAEDEDMSWTIVP